MWHHISAERIKTTTLYNESRRSNEIDKLIAPSSPPPSYKQLMTLPLERPRLLHNHLSSLMYVWDYKKRRGPVWLGRAVTKEPISIRANEPEQPVPSPGRSVELSTVRAYNTTTTTTTTTPLTHRTLPSLEYLSYTYFPIVARSK